MCAEVGNPQITSVDKRNKPPYFFNNPLFCIFVGLQKLLRSLFHRYTDVIRPDDKRKHALPKGEAHIADGEYPPHHPQTSEKIIHMVNNKLFASAEARTSSFYFFIGKYDESVGITFFGLIPGPLTRDEIKMLLSVY